ncbi:SMI1/KNR4 family protein [Niastella caeni]|uniref:SMI1/KNR4 family protein n=1 Tax=Niastella caeni TaxID=2569763 RepID=A0A4S8HSD2_9BACT|nr:SMI1/KNR4 family protein [Niastella caeni]THU38205.1 SMI1/KNR4 family protein [Niastella caeni]
MTPHQQYIQSVIDKSLTSHSEFSAAFQFPIYLIPKEMIDLSKPPVNDEIVYWKAIPANISDEEFVAFESTIGYPLPETYKAFLSYKYFIELNFGHEACFFRHTASWSQDYYENISGIIKEETFDVGYFPFATNTDIGYFCFDTKNAAPDNEYRVVTYDREYGIEAYPSTVGQFTFIDFINELEATLYEWEQRKNNS